MCTDNLLKIVSAMPISAVVFGVGAIVVLTVPVLNAQAKYLLPGVIVASFALAALSAGQLAKRMRIRNWGRMNLKKGDSISG